MSQSFPTDHLLDVTDVSCPLPLLKTKLTLKTMESGKVLLVKATDAGSWRDIPRYIEMSEHELLAAEETTAGYCYWIRKGDKQ
ncbi:sulfurtransferase TusA family protein [Oceanobacter mangrovi]|uniref:sulfurtransferase TusA family protein n=1 Tax=Oceanobacter mangrovi TaxID=2862510 RepID=UPI0031BA07E5